LGEVIDACRDVEGKVIFPKTRDAFGESDFSGGRQKVGSLFEVEFGNREASVDEGATEDEMVPLPGLPLEVFDFDAERSGGRARVGDIPEESEVKIGQGSACGVG